MVILHPDIISLWYKDIKSYQHCLPKILSISRLLFIALYSIIKENSTQILYKSKKSFIFARTLNHTEGAAF